MNPDRRPPLDATSLRSALSPPWRHLEVVAETGSTNADLIARAAAGEDIDGVVLIAEHQTTVIVVGVGLNVTLSPEEAGDPGATSLLGVEAPDRDVLVARLLEELGRGVDVWWAVSGAGGGLSDDYRARSLTIGNPVRATLPGGREIVGTARSIDEQGRLCIEASGQLVAVSAGDVVNLRPSP